MPQSKQINSLLTHIIQKLDLRPHPEGGFLKETYRCSERIKSDSLDNRYLGERSYSTCIYFLLTSDTFSAFHRIHQDEIWHFYSGSPIYIHTITNEGIYSKSTIGCHIERGEIPQFVVTGGTWFGATLVNDNDYALVGCTVAPGFDFQDFELAVRSELIVCFPQYKDIITRLTRR